MAKNGKPAPKMPEKPQGPKGPNAGGGWRNRGNNGNSGGPANAGNKPRKGGDLEVHNPKPGKGGGGNGGGGKGHGGGGNVRYGAHGGYKGVKRSTAVKLVQPEIRKQLRELRREARKVRSNTRDLRQEENARYNRTTGDLEHLYGESRDYIKYQNDQTTQNFEDTRSRAAAAQAALAQQIAANGQVNAGGAGDELARLGLQGSGNGDAFAGDQAFAQNVAAFAGSANANTLNAMQNGAATVGNLIAGMNEGSRASALGNASNTHQGSLRDIQNNKLDAMLDVREAMRNARASRPELINAMLQQLAETGWAQYMDTQNLNLQKRQLNLQAQAQHFAQRQSLRAEHRANNSGGGGGHGYAASSHSSGGGSSSGSGGSSGSSGGGYHLPGAGSSHKSKPKPKPKPSKPNWPDAMP